MLGWQRQNGRENGYGIVVKVSLSTSGRSAAGKALHGEITENEGYTSRCSKG